MSGMARQTMPKMASNTPTGPSLYVSGRTFCVNIKEPAPYTMTPMTPVNISVRLSINRTDTPMDIIMDRGTPVARR